MATISGEIGGTARLQVTITKIERVKSDNSTKVYYTLTYPGAPTSIRILQAKITGSDDYVLQDFSGNGTSDTSWGYESFS